MPSQSNTPSIHAQTATRTALLLLAITINAVEMLLPRIPFLPWLKPGLANIVTIVWIVRYGVGDALLFSLLRVWAVAFYLGFSFITLSLSLAGGLTSCIIMGAAWHLLARRGKLGAIGIAILGALAHNVAQLSVVYLLLARNYYLMYQVPAMLAASVLFGSLVGRVTALFLPAVEEAPHQAARMHLPFTYSSPGPLNAVAGIAILAANMSLVAVDNKPALAAIAALTTAAVQIVERGSLGALLFPIHRFWILFLFIAFLYGLFGFGTKVPEFPLLTYEGIDQTLAQWLRLWTWLEASFLLRRVLFHVTAFQALRRLFPGRRSTLYAGLRAVELFPWVMELMRTEGRSLLRVLLRNPRRFIGDLYQKMSRVVMREEERTQCAEATRGLQAEERQS